ncbi:hypothetical protein [Cohnella mopanensis]|uniref:hypothetical protein n=1 Tax=Cohnella mopanensis TaxID=2911966 RepID=UPI001EF8E3AA|nr:hypothetical protein [Cohnella mopanensis]
MEYTSRYPALGFYVNDEVHYFSTGRYVTDDPETIAVLDSIPDAIRVESEVTNVQTEASEAPTDEKPVAKPRKSSAK